MIKCWVVSTLGTSTVQLRRADITGIFKKKKIKRSIKIDRVGGLDRLIGIKEKVSSVLRSVLLPSLSLSKVKGRRRPDAMSLLCHPPKTPTQSAAVSEGTSTRSIYTASILVPSTLSTRFCYIDYPQINKQTNLVVSTCRVYDERIILRHLLVVALLQRNPNVRSI